MANYLGFLSVLFVTIIRAQINVPFTNCAPDSPIIVESVTAPAWYEILFVK